MVPIVPLFLSFVTCALFFLLVRKRRSQHLLFENMNVPGPKPTFLSGNIKDTKKATLLHTLLIKWRKEFGKTFGYYEGPVPVLVTSELSIIREVFIKQFNNFHGRKLFPLQPEPEDPKTNHMFTARGGKWKRLRGIISPTFSSAKLKQTVPIINNKVAILLHQVAIHAVRGKGVDVLSLFQALTMEVIGSAAFGMDLNSQTNPNEPFLNKAQDMLTLYEKGSWIKSIAEYLPEMRPLIVRSLSAAITITKATPAPVWFLKHLSDVIVMRRQEYDGWSSGKPKRHDMMQLMLEAEEDDSNTVDSNTSVRESQRKTPMTSLQESPRKAPVTSQVESPTDSTPLQEADIRVDIPNIPCNNNNNVDEDPKVYSNGLTKKTTKKLSTDEIKGQSFLFLVAGYETTAHTLSFACYLLAQHQEIQDKLRVEVDAHIKGKDDISFDVLGKMEYLEMVVSETLRLFPIANVVVNRLCMHDTVVGELTIKEGTVVQANVMDIHMDHDIWGPHDTHAFHPARFDPSVHCKRDPMAYLPFGIGPRNCVGMRFALLEVKLALARLIKHFYFFTCEQTQIPLKLKEVPALTPVDGIILKVAARGEDLIPSAHS